jgi:glycosyltransferase involved in cell wall biosynthesis
MIRGLLDSPSIARYGDQILEGLARYHPEIELSENKLPNTSSLPIGRIGRGIATQLVRYAWYPIKARRSQGDLKHITDHVHAYLLRYLPAGQTIVTCHDLTTFVHPENINSTSLFPSIGHSVFQRSISCLHEAARVIAVSENTRKDILAYSQCDPDQVRVVYHGVDEIFTGNRNPERVLEFRRKFAPDGARLLLHVGLTRPYKNIESVLRVLSILTGDMGHNVRLIKVGQEFTAGQQKLIQDLGLANRIVHLGRLEPRDLVLSYQSCDALLFPSIYEGFGWPPLEAMSCGTPVIASNTGSIPEIVGDAGILEEPTAVAKLAQATASLLGSADLTKRLIEAGLRRAKLFTKERAVSQLAEIYKDVCLSR